jgi:hypothetical protein
MYYRILAYFDYRRVADSASKVYQVKEIAKETNPSVNTKCQAIEIRK